MKKNEDISKKTVMALAIIVILVSIFGTWAVLQNAPQITIKAPAPAFGNVAINVLPADTPAEPATSEGVNDNG